MRLVFVYGQYKKKERQHAYLGMTPRFLGHHSTAPEFTMFNMVHPNMPVVLSKGHTSIKGEVYGLNETDYLEYLKHENVPRFVVPKLITTQRNSIRCVMTVLSPELIAQSFGYIKNYPIITSGEWSGNEKSDIAAVEDVQCGC